MNKNEILKNTILLVRSGSHAYGTSTPSSDVDTRGIAIAPVENLYGFGPPFDQYMDKDEDFTVLDVRKFFRLAADGNPGMIEMLFVHPDDVLKETTTGSLLLSGRDSFLSRQVEGRFVGYAMGQLRRMKSHKSWLLNPPTHQPTRAEFELPENVKISESMLGAYDKVVEMGGTVDANVMQIVDREKRYTTALNHWNQYNRWKQERNPARAELEAKYGYDTKHAMHLVRLMRMCAEILRGEGVKVRRPDAEELLAIRNGAWTYDALMEWAETQKALVQSLRETSSLPEYTDTGKLNQLCVDIHYMFFACG